MPSALGVIYSQFLDTLSQGNVQAAAEFVAPGFRATLSETKVDLSFAEYLREIERQRTAFPDLGKHVRIIDLREDGNRIVVTYMMTVHFTGVLRSDDGLHEMYPTDAQKDESIAIPSQDRVEFTEDNRISMIEVVTDMGHTMGQVTPV